MPARSATRPLIALGAGALLVAGLAAPAQAAPSPRLETTGADVEEQRLPLVRPRDSEPFSQRMIDGTGLAGTVDGFAAALAAAEPASVDELVRSTGRELWSGALEHAQDADAAIRYEDRGLYWARLALREDLKAWAASGGVDQQRLTDLLQVLEEASRGLDELGFDADPGVTKVMISGFDPFQLDDLLERSNPSGAAALSLSGRIIETDAGPVQIQAVVLPVTWSRFDGGIVEDAYGPQLQAGDAAPQMAMTISQGRSGYDIERWASIWRGGFADNLNEEFEGEAPDAPGWPQTVDGAQFIETTLPADAMLAAGTGPFAVQLNHGHAYSFAEDRTPFVEVGTTDTTPPPAGAFAVSGGGGDYLSNESMYRVNRLRVGLGLDEVAGGHLHVPVLDYMDLAANRATNVEQTQQLILAAAAALTPGDDEAAPAPVPAPSSGQPAAPAEASGESLPAVGAATAPLLAASAAMLLAGAALLLRRRRA
ncbi:hypothetical protein [Arenivirga flava]|uniref:Gram-positive cocci surface proteins LPxTG domain-containing protein n=1 Tax=Arenivirga flava TaxID=1930060 RepID=A0AA37XA69_9MICO|nr:hypothetical protein [Arenivirga flava]GMA29489.1 hypothetical protein GCM10025874_27420 [Arenivirga flava]